MKVDGSLNSLLQGVSQQPPRDRLPGQATLQNNMSSDPITGLTRRPGTDLVDSLLTTSDLRGIHDLDTVDGNRYVAMFYESAVKVFNLNGVEATVTIDADAQAYIALDGDLRFNTVENETFVVNRSKTVEMTTGARSYFNGEDRQAFIIQVLGGQYGRTYTVKIDGTQYASYQVPDGSVSSHVNNVTTKNIATELYNDLNAGLPAGWVAEIEDDIITIYIDNTTDYTITVNDDYGNTNIKGSGITVGAVEDLPRFAPHNFVCRIAENTDPESDLWFRFIVEGYEDDWVSNIGLFGQQGYWQETVAPNTDIALDNATMPHVLKFIPSSGEFEFSRGAWEDREVGTTTSNPDPSFVDAKINDVFTFQGRLGFLSGPNVIMSKSNDEYDFWFGSVSEQSDSDPIDVFSKIEASTMEAAIQHNRDLVIFSNKGQFIIYGRNSITPQTAALSLTSSFEAELNAKPVGAGRNVFFANNFGSYSGIREFYAESSTDINDSRNVTQHAKRYIEGSATKLSASSNYDTLFVSTDAAEDVLYWYQYIWQNSEKVQSSWSRITYPLDIEFTFFEEETLYLVMKDGDDYYLTRMSLDVTANASVGYHLHLDLRFDASGVDTQFMLPYDFLKDEDLLCIQGDGCPTPGLRANIASITGTPGNYTVTLKKDMGGGDVIVGVKFRSAYRPTMPLIKDKDNVKVGTGTLTVSRFMIALYQTGEINGQVLSRYGDGPVVSFNGRIIGAPDNKVGEQPLSDYTFVLPFGHKPELAEIEFWTDSHLPMTLLDIEWVGQYNKRGKRVQGSSGG